MTAAFGDPAGLSFVLIATYGRSGSTLLQALLGSNPDWYIRGENYDTLGGLFDSVHAARRTHSEFGRNVTAPDNPWHGADLISPNEFEHSLVQSFTEHVLAPPPGARAVGFKEIRVFRRTAQAPAFFDFVLSAFAPAKIVFLRRDAGDVSRSGWWKGVDADEVRSFVDRCDLIMADYARLHPDDTIVVDYENLTPDSRQIPVLFEFLGEQFVTERVEAVLQKRLGHGVKSQLRALAGEHGVDDMVAPNDDVKRRVRLGRWSIALGRDADAD